MRSSRASSVSPRARWACAAWRSRARGAEEPAAHLIFSIPAEAWSRAVEGMPVLKLELNNA